MFSTASLQSYAPAIVACAQNMCSHLIELDGQEIDLLNYMGRLAMDVVGKAAFGYATPWE